MSDKLTQGNRSVEKAFQIIEVMAHNQHAMRLIDIAQACGMSSSTVLRMLATLLDCGYVQQDSETSKYFLTIKFCHLSNLVSRQISIRNTVHPFLVDLAGNVKEYVTIAIEREMVLYYIDEINGQANYTSLRVADGIGRAAMLHTNGIGKLFLSEFTSEKLDYYIARFGLPRMTQNTLTTREELVKNLEEIRTKGYSVDREESEIGIRSIAAPIRDWRGEMIAGISIACPTPRYTEEQLLELIPLLTGVAHEISGKFFSE